MRDGLHHVCCSDLSSEAPEIRLLYTTPESLKMPRLRDALLVGDRGEERGGSTQRGDCRGGGTAVGGVAAGEGRLQWEVGLQGKGGCSGRVGGAVSEI